MPMELLMVVQLVFIIIDMKVNNDLIYSSALSFLVVFLAGGYYYYKNKSIPVTPVINTPQVLQDSVSDEIFDANLIDTTTSHVLSEKEIWSELYPGKKSKRNQYGGISERAIMRVEKEQNRASIYYYSTIHRIFYYKHEGRQKAFVVLVSYPFDYYTENPADCHGCVPAFSIANWYYKEGEWHLENFTQNWKGGMGSWGQPAELIFKMTTLGYSLEMDHAFCQGGYCEGYYVLYEIPSLKIITEKTYNTSEAPEDYEYNDSETIDATIDSLSNEVF